MSSNDRIKISCILLAVFSFAQAELASGQSVTQPVRGIPIKLFDGTTLDGWSQENGDASKNWRVEDGAIAWNSKGGDLYHEHWYRDFELTFQWKLNANGNSGIKYRVQPYGKRLLGCEYQIFDDKEAAIGKQSTGSLYALYPPIERKVTNPIGQWNQSKIVVCGDRVEHWLNETKVMEARFGSSDWFARVADSKFSQYERFGLNREGRIFLQDHGNPVWFREIVVTPLDCDCVPAANACTPCPQF